VLQSILQAFYEEAEKQQTTISPVVLSINPKITEQLHGVRAIHRMRLLQIIRTIRKSDGVISGGGSLLQDMTGRMTIPYYLGIVKIAQWLKKPTFIYSQGVGPIRIKLYYPFIRHIYNRCAYITLRDGESKTFLQSIGVKHPHMEVVSDPVVGLVTEQVPPGFVNRQIALSEAQDEQNTPIIGVSVRFWRQDRDDLHQIAHALRLIVEQSHVQLRFLPFQMPADLKASQYVIDLLGETYRNRITLLTDAIHPQDMLSEVGQCDLVIGVRLHSLIYAANYAIPMVGISYDPKIDQFLHQLQMTATAQTDHIDPHKVAEEAIQLLENKQTWIDHKKPLIEQMKKKSHLPAQQITSILRNKG
jgi:polysaccharide pyruvyl transferase CsaB